MMAHAVRRTASGPTRMVRIDAGVRVVSSREGRRALAFAPPPSAQGRDDLPGDAALG
jgi:hypothetical protein